MKKSRTLVFSDTELDLLAELLRVAQSTLLETSHKLALSYPTSATVERLNVDAESAADLRERIEER